MSFKSVGPLGHIPGVHCPRDRPCPSCEAIAIEAAAAGETPKDGSTEGESAGPQDIAPNTAAQKDSPDV